MAKHFRIRKGAKRLLNGQLLFSKGLNSQSIQQWLFLCTMHTAYFGIVPAVETHSWSRSAWKESVLAHFVQVANSKCLYITDRKLVLSHGNKKAKYCNAPNQDWNSDSTHNFLTASQHSELEMSSKIHTTTSICPLPWPHVFRQKPGNIHYTLSFM